MKTFFLLLVVLSTQAFAIDWQGHRGARGLYPENSIGAMEEALKYPVTTLEFDVVVSKDNKIVVSHEPWINEEFCTDGSGRPVKGKTHNMYKLTYDEIRTFDCGSMPHPRFPRQKKIKTTKPLMQDLINHSESLLAKLKRPEVEYNIEIKSTVEDEKDGFQPNYETFSDMVISQLLKQIPAKKFVIQSFDWRVLQYVHKKYPEVRLSALTENKINPEKDLKTLGFIPYAFSPYYKDLKESHVKAFHAKKIMVIPWTINDEAGIKEMKAIKVDGIITDYPDLISK